MAVERCTAAGLQCLCPEHGQGVCDLGNLSEIVQDSWYDSHKGAARNGAYPKGGSVRGCSWYDSGSTVARRGEVFTLHTPPISFASPAPCSSNILVNQPSKLLEGTVVPVGAGSGP